MLHQISPIHWSKLIHEQAAQYIKEHMESLEDDEGDDDEQMS